MSLSPAQKEILDFVAERYHEREFRVPGRSLRSFMSGTTAEKNTLLATMVPGYLVQQGEPPQEQYSFALQGALLSNHGHAYRQYVGKLLGVLKHLGKRDPVFETFSAEDIKRDSGLIAAAFREDHDFRWIDQLIRLAGLCDKPDETPEGGPWPVPKDIEQVVEAKNVDEFLALRGVGVARDFEKDIDEALHLQPVPSDAESLAEVCAKLTECIHRHAEIGSVYRLLCDGPVDREKIKDREDHRLRGILTALREDLLDDGVDGSGEAAETEWLARAAKVAGDRGKSHAALLSLIERGYALGRQARVLVLVARESSTEKWHGVFGRIDLVREGDPPPNDIWPRGNVRVIEKRPSKDELLSSLAAAMRGQPLVVGDVELDSHGLEGGWHGERDSENGLRYKTKWPNVVLTSGEFKNRLFIEGPFQTDEPGDLFGTLESLAWAASGFSHRPGVGDLRIRRVQVLLWDYRGRIDQLRVKGRKLYIQVYPPTDTGLSLVGLVEGVDGQSSPLVKPAPAAEVIALNEDIARVRVKLERDGDAVVAHDASAARGQSVHEVGWTFNQFGPEPEDPEVEDRVQAEPLASLDREEDGDMPDPKNVFIIHGRNLAARDQMGIFLRSMGLRPINFGDLRARMSGTATIAEIVERGMAEAQGVIALITPDEYATLRPEFRGQNDDADAVARWQARPNVIFEAGMAFGKNKERVIFVLFGDPKLFTDVAGIHVLRPTNNPTGDRGTLHSWLAQGAGCDVEPHSKDWMNAGDFVGCVPELPKGDQAEALEEANDAPAMFGLSAEATDTLRRLAGKYVEAEYPNYQAWFFGSGSDGPSRSLKELRAFGFIEPFGTGGKKWRLTSRGRDAVLQVANQALP